jgi:DNA repair protein RecN (Recombination protein N)
MLRDLRIRNFALIDELEVSFEAGLNVVTGETGAGKTILMSALGLAVGGKGAADLIRTGEDEATIEAVFTISGADAKRLGASGIDSSGDELLVRRVLQRSGRNRVHLNGTLATLALLESIGESLIRVYGQHEHTTLRQTETHLGVVDAFAQHPELLSRTRDRYEEFRALDERLRKVVEGKDAARARAEFLRFQSNEIAEVAPGTGEDEDLAQERRVLGAAEKLAEAARFGEEVLYAGEAAAATTVKKVAQRLGELVSVDPRLEEVVKLLDEGGALLEDAGWRLREYAERVTFDPDRLEQVETRLARLERLKRKYAGSLAEILSRKEEIDRELADLDLGEEGLAALEHERSRAEGRVRDAAAALSESRRAAARRLESRVHDELAGLGLAGARLEVRFSEGPLTAEGADRVELYLGANPGEEPRSLARVASGGELSRIMLALKSVALEDAEAPTVIFDEVDAGIGGGVAEVVGRKLASIAAARQVLCITHLPQIAAFADHHFAVEKSVAKGRTRSVTRRLADAERRDEVARMLGGVRATDEAKRHAEQLLDSARPGRPQGR